MDIWNMLQNATIFDEDGEIRGQTTGFEVIGGRMRLMATMFDQYEYGEEPDDGVKEDIPEDDASNTKDNLVALVGGGKRG